MGIELHIGYAIDLGFSFYVISTLHMNYLAKIRFEFH